MSVRKLLSVFSLVAVATAVPMMGAEAQTATRPVVFGVKAGMAVPLGSFSDGSEIGFIVGGLAQFRPQGFPFTMRGEVDYSRYGAKGDDNASSRILGFTLNGIYDFPSQTQTRFYGIGGLGLYNVKFSREQGDATVSVSENDFGLNGGLGVQFPLSGFTAHIEGRFHWIFTSGESGHVLPLTFGITF